MTETKDNSSLPLLLSITGAVVVVAVGGWFFLDQDTVPAGGGDRASEAPTTAEMKVAAEAPSITEEAPEDPVDETPVPESAPVDEASPVVDVQAELSKARMAANADILVFPEEQSALHYYGLALAADPQNAVAVAELDAILASVAQTVAQHLDAEEYDEAYRTAAQVARLRPEHTLVFETQRRLDELTEQLVEDAIESARAGKDQEADELFAAAAALPGRNPDYLEAVRDSITEIRNVRVAAQRDRARRAKLAADQARAAWVNSVRNAIETGNLVSPVGASARDLLAEEDRWSAERTQLTAELVTALVDTTQFFINDGRLAEAEELLQAVEQMGDDVERYAALRVSLENAYLETESKRVATLKELVQTKRVSPRYPKRAQQFNMTGWVDLFFTVTPTGETTDIEIVRSNPEQVFDRAAVNAVAKWEFQPIEYRGQVISQRAAARLVFAIE